MGRARNNAFDKNPRRKARIPELLIEIDENGVSVGRYEVTAAIREAVDNFRVAKAGSTRVFVPYSRESDAAVFAEQLCAIMRKPVEDFIVIASDLNLCQLRGTAGSASIRLSNGSARRIARALHEGEALIFESQSASELVALQRLLAVSLDGSETLPLTVSCGDYSVEVLPSPLAYAFFPVDYDDDDARLLSSSLVGARALSLDTSIDESFLSASSEVKGHIMAEGGIDGSEYSSKSEPTTTEHLQDASVHKVLTSVNARVQVIAENTDEDETSERLREIASADPFPFDAELIVAGAVAAERLRVAANTPDSKLVCAITPEDLGILLAEAGLQAAALGNAEATVNFMRSLDHLVSARFTGAARQFILVESMGHDAVKTITEIFAELAASSRYADD